MKYTVTVEEMRICIYTVEAENEKEARYKYNTGEWTPLIDGPKTEDIIKIEPSK